MSTVAEILAKHNLGHVDVYADYSSQHTSLPSEFIAAVVLAARADDAKVEVRVHGLTLAACEWVPASPATAWNWNQLTYRICPACRPRSTRPWSKPEDIPDAALWIRYLDQEARQWIITAIDKDGIYTFDDSSVLSWVYLAGRKVEWSDRERKVWRRCEVET